MKDTIRLARTALLNGEKRIPGYWIYTAKIDLDEKLSFSKDVVTWNETRRAILEYLGCTVIDINTTNTERGQHTVISYLSKNEMSDEERNIIQLFLGDDITRYKINKRRIERGVPFDKANILFSNILKRYPHEDDSKIKIALERIVGNIE